MNRAEIDIGQVAQGLHSPCFSDPDTFGQGWVVGLLSPHLRFLPILFGLKSRGELNTATAQAIPTVYHETSKIRAQDSTAESTDNVGS